MSRQREELNAMDTNLMQPAPETPLIWTSRKSDNLLNHGVPMTGSEALAYAASGARNSHSFEEVTPTHIRWVSGFGVRCEYVGTYPVPTDPDAINAALKALTDHLRDLGMDLAQRDLIISAVQAALVRDDAECVRLLEQVLAMPIPPALKP